MSSPRRPVQNQAASSTESPERPVSPQKAEAKAAFRQPASPEPAQEAAAAQPPSSPDQPASPERPEAHAAKAQAGSAVQPGVNSSSSTGAHQGADISMPSDPVIEQGGHKDSQAAEPQAGDMIVEGKANNPCGTLPLQCFLPAEAAIKGKSKSLFVVNSAKLIEVTCSVGAR